MLFIDSGRPWVNAVSWRRFSQVVVKPCPKKIQQSTREPNKEQNHWIAPPLWVRPYWMRPKCSTDDLFALKGKAKSIKRGDDCPIFDLSSTGESELSGFAAVLLAALATWTWIRLVVSPWDSTTQVFKCFLIIVSRDFENNRRSTIKSTTISVVLKA